MLRRPALAAVLAAVGAVACAPRRPPPDLSLDPVALLAQVEAAAAVVTAVRGEARLRLDAPGAKGTVPAFVAAERPDRLHVEALDFFGNPAATLVTSGGRLAIYDARARAFYRGAATAANLARLVPLPLSPERLVSVLCGAPRLAGAPVSAEPGRGDVTLTLADGPGTTSARVGPRAALLEASFRGGAPAVPDHRVAYSAFEDLERVRFPTEVVVTASDPAVRVELQWREPEVGARLDAALFRMEPPAGARVVDLDAEPQLPPLTLPLTPAPEAPPQPSPGR
jgi:hypothetical protein